MTVDAPASTGPVNTRSRFGELFRRQRGTTPIARLAADLGMSRQAVMELERGWRDCPDCEGTALSTRKRWLPGTKSHPQPRIIPAGSPCPRCAGSGCPGRVISNPTLQRLEEVAAALNAERDDGNRIEFEVVIVNADDPTRPIVHRDAFQKE